MSQILARQIDFHLYGHLCFYGIEAFLTTFNFMVFDYFLAHFATAPTRTKTLADRVPTMAAILIILKTSSRVNIEPGLSNPAILMKIFLHFRYQPGFTESYTSGGI